MKENIKKIVKRIIPLSVRNSIRTVQSMLWKYEQIVSGLLTERHCFSKYDGNLVFLVGVPEHGNLGDQAIAYAEKEFLHARIKDVSIIFITEYGFYNKYIHLKRYIKTYPESIIIWHGGGNIGELYKYHESMRLFALKHFRNTRFLIMPQTIDYSDESENLEYAKTIYNQHNKLILFTRERESYNKAIHLFTNCRLYLVPDIVLSIKPYLCEKHRNGVLLCARNDGEACAETKNRLLRIISLLKETGVSYTLTDTCDEEKYACSFEKQGKEIINKLKEFAASKIVITDRLHGVIFSLITKTPCIALDNSTQKVSSFYHTWLEKSGVLLIEHDNELDEVINFISSETQENTFIDSIDVDILYYDLIKELSTISYSVSDQLNNTSNS